ncbi:hypothetical protein GLOIN_2v1786147 [Rhizophagus irregularis DAOM 181602=DAOM 197198]|nr:hypothetical protein GLOIN_2v1786147 [Rhizophagus irregularis DAOM 181602=DAOM 197198]
MAEISGGITSLKGDEETVVLVFCVVILRVEEAIFRDADADDRDAGVEVAIFGGVGVDEVAIFGGVAVEEAIFCGVSVDEVVIFRDADVDDRDAGVEEAIFRDADADDRDAGVEVAIFGAVAVEEAIFCGVDVDEVAIFRDADADDRDAGVEVAIFGGVGVDEVAIFCGAGVDDSAIFGGGVFGFDGRRKRIAANILDEYNNPSSSTSERTYAEFTTRKPRSKVPCYCSNCNGKMIDPRTKERHEQTNSLEPLNSDKAPTSQELVELIDSTISLEEPQDTTISLVEPQDTTIPLNHKIRQYLLIHILIMIRMRNNNMYFFHVKKGQKQAHFVILLKLSKSLNQLNMTRMISTLVNLRHKKILLIMMITNFQVILRIILILCSTYQIFHTPNISELPTDELIKGILIWIMKFRSSHNIPNTAIEELIQFIKIILKVCKNINPESFPNSLYMLRKALGLIDRFTQFAACQKCHKLYKKEDIISNDDNTIMKCSHVEFPNSATKRLKQCQTPLGKKISLNNSISIVPELIYPVSSIQQQLSSMFKRPGFEELLRHWTRRSVIDNVLSDIYDGQIWQNLKESNEQGSNNFFRPDKADTHLGLMINLDWFQPYEGTIYSTGVIYAIICNLPRDVRFKPENMLILGILPGPNEVKLHRVNHYLSPIITELESLWEGVILNRTYECPNGKDIRAALIIASCDIPGARKLCGHISALASCHRCEKRANNRNFGGMADMSDWFIMKDPVEHRQKALEWRRCKSNAERERFVKENGVRWSEILRLPYFDPIRFVVVDPMHCLFLGIAKWITKRIWIDEGVLTEKDLQSIQKKMDEFKVPSDLGRIPGKIHCGEGFSNFTADQWRNFFLIYATVALWNHLPGKDRKILTYFVRVCTILVRRIVEINDMKEAHELLIKIIKLIEECYGEEKIMPNLHLSLHLCECSYDYGPLYSFWCFSFERMNGLLGSLPNSHRQIEPELMRRLMTEAQINDIINSSSSEVIGLELLDKRPSVGSLSEFPTDEMYRFLMNSRNISESPITGCEEFPGKFLALQSKDIHLEEQIYDLLIEYYEDTYVDSIFRKPFTENLPNSTIIINRANRYGKCQICAETFGSAAATRHIKSSFVLAKFINRDGNSVDTYPGQIQFFFEHSVHLSSRNLTHKLAYIKWYKPANLTSRFHFSIDDDVETCNVELWEDNFYPSSRDNIIPIHNILGRFIPVKYKKSDRSNAREYLAVIPINRKFHLR